MLWCEGSSYHRALVMAFMHGAYQQAFVTLPVTSKTRSMLHWCMMWMVDAEVKLLDFEVPHVICEGSGCVFSFKL